MNESDGVERRRVRLCALNPAAREYAAMGVRYSAVSRGLLILYEAGDLDPRRSRSKTTASLRHLQTATKLSCGARSWKEIDDEEKCAPRAPTARIHFALEHAFLVERGRKMLQVVIAMLGTRRRDTVLRSAKGEGSCKSTAQHLTEVAKRVIPPSALGL
jgi:hypothetical protein